MAANVVMIYERDAELRQAYALALSRERVPYKLVFADDPVRLPDLLQQHPDVRLLVWDLDQLAGRLPKTLDALRRGRLPLHEHPFFSTRATLAALRPIRRTHPSLPVLLIAHQFPRAFEAAVLQDEGPLQFLTQPWDLRVVVEKIRAMLSGRGASIRHWVVRLPVATS